MTTDDRQRYEAVRRQLESRGYLDGRIERFMLAELVGADGRRPRVFRTALKAAVVGGPLLGSFLAITVAGGSRGVLDASDWLWLWLYCAIAAGVALAGLVLAAVALVAVATRRRGRVRSIDGLSAGVVVAVPTLLYLLAVWWRRDEAGDWLADVAFLAGANLATLLVAWLAGLISLASAIGRTGVAPDRRRRPVALVLLLLAPLSVAWFVGRAAGGSARAAAASGFEVDGTAPRLLFVGIDGWSRAEIESAAAGDEGWAEALDAALRFPIHREEFAEPAEVWTTMATGVPAAVHGIRGAGAERLPGVGMPLRAGRGRLPLTRVLEWLLPTVTVPATGRTREVRTLWEVVALRQRSFASGWWASWPADQDREVASRALVLSDRVLPKLLAGGPPNREAHPASIWSRLAEEFPTDQELLREEFRSRFGRIASTDLERLAWESFLIDGYRWRALERFAEDDGIRAYFLYLPGLDILERRVEGVDGAAEVVERYRAWLVTRVLDAPGVLGPESQTIVVGERGRERSTDDGLLLWWGGPAERCAGPPIRPEDVAAVQLAAVGFPASRELVGRTPATGCAGETIARRERVRSFGRRQLDSTGPVADDVEMVERLRSLGYVR